MDHFARNRFVARIHRIFFEMKINLRIRRIIMHQIALQWNVGPNDASFNVYRGTQTGGPYTKIASGVTGGTTSASFNDTSIVAGTKYSYVVTAVDPTGVESAPSNEATATAVASTATVPTGLTATAS